MMHSDYHLRHFQMSTVVMWPVSSAPTASLLCSTKSPSSLSLILLLSILLLHLLSPDKTEFFFLSLVSKHSLFSFSPNKRNIFSSFLSHPSFPLIHLFFLSVSFPPQLFYPSCFPEVWSVLPPSRPSAVFDCICFVSSLLPPLRRRSLCIVADMADSFYPFTVLRTKGGQSSVVL